ncbi:MAG: sulfotransferase [Pseudomonadales bacterium]|nr:sulfotransferase [Pseudomonadales bacterium]
MNSFPFFILGSVRSGTTLLRDLLKQHPNLDCPEETHFFRWSEPFGTEAYEKNYARKALFKKHRQLDGVENFDFFYTMQNASDRRELMDHYARLFLEAKGKGAARWFDKTPQNVYGILLISAAYPEAKFVHIHRHPYNVVASLKAGRMLNSQEIRGAVNFWTESLSIVQQFKQGFPDRMIEIAYENLVEQPQQTINQLLDYLDEKSLELDLDSLPIHEEKNRYKELLSLDDLEAIHKQCGDLMKVYGYQIQAH